MAGRAIMIQGTGSYVYYPLQSSASFALTAWSRKALKALPGGRIHNSTGHGQGTNVHSAVRIGHLPQDVGRSE